MSIRKRRSIFDIIEEYFESVEQWMDRIRESLIEGPSWDCKSCTIKPLSDITVASDKVIITVDLPYAEESTIKVVPIDKDMIEITAKMRRKISFDDFGITHHKGEFHTFKCQVYIPVPVYVDRMEIKFKKGILVIELPRKREYEIPIK